MLLSAVKKALIAKGAGARIKDDEVLADTLHEALIWVASRCVPVVLLRRNDESETVLRHLEQGFYVAAPKRPDMSNANEHLQIDDDLDWAVINYAMFLLMRDEGYRMLARELVAAHASAEARGNYDTWQD